MAEYRITLGVDVDIGDVQSQINNIRPDPIDLRVNLNTRDLQSQIGSIRQQLMSLSNMRINIGGSGGGFGGSRGNNGFMGNINNNISQITTTANNANNTIQRLRQTLASARFDNSSIDMVTQHLEQMNMAVTNVTSRIRNNNLRLNITGTDELGRTVTVLKEINLATGEITNVGKNISQSFGRTREEINQTNNAYREMKSLIKEMSSTSIGINKARASGQEFGALEHKLAALNARYDELEANFASSLDVNQTRNLSNEWQKVAHDINIANEAITNSRANLLNGINQKLFNSDIGLSGFDDEISRVTTKFNNLTNQTEPLRAAMTSLRTAFDNVKTAARSGTDDELISANREYLQVLRDVENQLNINARAEQDAIKANLLNNKKAGLLAETNQWLKDNSRAAKQFGGEIQRIQSALANCTTDSGFKQLASDFGLAKKQAKELGLTGKTLGDSLKEQFQKYSQYLSVASVIMWTTQGLKDMFNQVVAIDSAMTELKKVTNETDASYDKFLSNAASRAKEIGTTIDGLVSSTADFARLGYDFEESAGLAEVANIYTVVGDEIDGVEGATQSLVSTLAAFKHEMGDMSDSDFAMSIVDKFNEVSNNFAISSGGIGEALQRSASSLAAANTTLDESIALITAANTVVQNPEKVGKLAMPT